MTDVLDGISPRRQAASRISATIGAVELPGEP